MKSWGVGSFENDSAQQFIQEVVQDGLPALREAFEVILDPDLDYVEAEEAGRALAAAEIVLAGVSGNTQAITDAGLRAWLADNTAHSAALSALRELAAEAIARVLAPESELPELWQDSPDAAAWQSSVQRLQASLV